MISLCWNRVVSLAMIRFFLPLFFFFFFFLLLLGFISLAVFEGLH